MSNPITYWYPTSTHRNRIGYITDVYSCGYVELFDMDSNTYTIKKYNELQLTNNALIRHERSNKGNS
jgi:hypothetical protein